MFLDDGDMFTIAQNFPIVRVESRYVEIIVFMLFPFTCGSGDVLANSAARIALARVMPSSDPSNCVIIGVSTRFFQTQIAVETDGISFASARSNVCENGLFMGLKVDGAASFRSSERACLFPPITIGGGVFFFGFIQLNIGISLLSCYYWRDWW